VALAGVAAATLFGVVGKFIVLSPVVDRGHSVPEVAKK
jgi:hypothetical protein